MEFDKSRWSCSLKSEGLKTRGFRELGGFRREVRGAGGLKEVVVEWWGSNSLFMRKES